MPKDEGFTLLETLIALLLGTALLLAALSASQQLQVWSRNLTLLCERDENLHLCPLLLSRWILPAGNNRWRAGWTGISAAAGSLELRSDIDGPGGFPDRTLTQSFEAIGLRQRNSDLQLRSDDGSFQPVLKNVVSFRAESDASPLLTIRLAAETEHPLLALGRRQSESLEMRFFLSNYRPNLFAEAP